jgi:hypothetical protein
MSRPQKLLFSERHLGLAADASTGKSGRSITRKYSFTVALSIKLTAERNSLAENLSRAIDSSVQDKEFHEGYYKGRLNIRIICLDRSQSMAVPWFRGLVAGLSGRRPGFAPSQSCGICGRQSDTGTGFLRVHPSAFLSIFIYRLADKQ